MKHILILSLALAVPSFGGTSAKQVIPPPAPNPCQWTWFTGGSVGYLTELEEPMYNLHVGTDTCWNIGGWNVAMFAEIGYTEKSEDYSANYVTTAPPATTQPQHHSFTVDELGSLLSQTTSPYSRGYDLDIMPITFNVKLERPLTGNLNAYFGAGLGMANVDLSIDTGATTFSDNDWVFVGQVFAGLNYNFTPHCEVYGGARWIYFEDADLSDKGNSATLELDDDFLIELGVRYNF